MTDCGQTYSNVATSITVDTLDSVVISPSNVKYDSCNGGSNPSNGGDKIGSAAVISNIETVNYDGITSSTAFTPPTLAASCTGDAYPDLLWQTSLEATAGTYDTT